MEMTPYKIEILLHYHCTGESFGRMDAPVFRATMDEFVDEGIFEIQCGQYTPVRAAIECYVNALLTVPLPRKTWNVEMPK